MDRTLVRLVLVVVAVVAVLGWLMFNGLFGTSQLIVLATGDALRVTLDDGEPRESRGDLLVLEARPGTHELVFQQGTVTSTVKVKLKNGGERWVVPAPGQCFVVIDATRLYQHSTAFAQARSNPGLARSWSARVAERWRDGAAHKLGKGYWVEAPDAVKGGEVKVVKALPCEELARTDLELLTRLGFD